MFDFQKLVSKSKVAQGDSYTRRIKDLQSRNLETLHIESAVENSVQNLESGHKSFVIYGEPQSGKTELMIALTARLLDRGQRIIILLLNDNVALLDQNLTRFKKAGLPTIPVSFRELLDKSTDINAKTRIIFCKKNSSDLKRLLEITRKSTEIAVIDDEADYATPNSKINKNEVSKINDLTGKLVSGGIYIGVTATPARLDLNNTHFNATEYWVDYPPHSYYSGQNIFFPNDIKETSKFRLTLLPDSNDNPKYLRNALFGFLINSAYLNLARKSKNYSMLIHTSGKKIDHKQDFDAVNKIIQRLNDTTSSKCKDYYEQIWKIADARHTGEADRIVEFIFSNIESAYPQVMNSDNDSNTRIAGEPPSPFTIIIGGNSVSRGVTFENLLSMYFTRDSKHRIQQDTYIQRARMFGARGDYLEFFELSIPTSLYSVWRRAFIFHRLSLESRLTGNGVPIWHEGMGIKAAANSSIDNSRVVFTSGEMSFKKFNANLIPSSISDEESIPDFSKLRELKALLPSDAFPTYLLDFINAFSSNDESSVVVHKPRSVMGMSSTNTDYDDISRARGLVAGQDLKSKLKPDASHHLFIFYNDSSSARLIYKFNENISFLQGI